MRPRARLTGGRRGYAVADMVVLHERIIRGGASRACARAR